MKWYDIMILNLIENVGYFCEEKKLENSQKKWKY